MAEALISASRELEDKPGPPWPLPTSCQPTLTLAQEAEKSSASGECL